MQQSSIGLIGLGVMGANLSRNIARHGFATVVYNRTTKTMEDFVHEHGNDQLTGQSTIEAFVRSLSRPRKIILMVSAGGAVDAVIEELKPLLEAGDVIVDCGNSNFRDTIRREAALKKDGLLFVGCGVSGGEEGALHGPSLMPGGSTEAWKILRPELEAIAARDFSGRPCVTHVGENGAGHFVKMVHNGIEYAVMQMMAEAYDMLRSLYGLQAPEIAKVFEQLHHGKLNSYLFQIAIPVLLKKDDLKHDYLIDSILDKAGQKGTGGWTVIDAIEHGVAVPSIAEAVFARTLSSQKEKRLELAVRYKTIKKKPSLSQKKFLAILEDALYAGMLSAYAQGYDLIATGAAQEKWTIDLAEISRIWEGGCIIRAKILNTLHHAYADAPEKMMHLLELPAIAKAMKQSLPALRLVVSLGATSGIPTPAQAMSLAYVDSMTAKNSPANFIQGLRDYFGAHTYERIDREGKFHTNWQA